jgi:predicted RNase H-like HicB family nuclease
MTSGPGSEYLKKPYTRALIPDEESGTFTARIIEFPGCVAEGATASEAYERLEAAAESWIEAALEMGQDIPPPAADAQFGGRFALRLPRSLHRAAAQLADLEGVSLNQLIVSTLAERVGGISFWHRVLGSVTTFATTAKVQAASLQRSFQVAQTATTPGSVSLLDKLAAGGH